MILVLFVQHHVRNFLRILLIPSNDFSICAGAVEDLFFELWLEQIEVLPDKSCDRELHIVAVERDHFLAVRRVDERKRAVHVTVCQQGSFMIQSGAKNLARTEVKFCLIDVCWILIDFV